MLHSLRVVLLLALIAGAGPQEGLAEDAAMPEDAAAPRPEVPEDAAASPAPSKPPAARASASPSDEELTAIPYVYPLARMRLTPAMR